MESLDTKEHKLQDQDQRQPAQTPDTCPNARRAKRMKCEVSGVEECHEHLPKTVMKQAVQIPFFIILHTYSHPHHDFSIFKLPAVSLVLLFFCRLSVWRLNLSSPVKTSRTWGAGWVLVSPSKNQVRLNEKIVAPMTLTVFTVTLYFNCPCLAFIGSI